jgi:hypothetical protein
MGTPRSALHDAGREGAHPNTTTGQAAEAFAALVAAVERKDFREARRRTSELRSLGWSCLPLSRREGQR